MKFSLVHCTLFCEIVLDQNEGKKIPVAQLVEEGNSKTKVMGSIPKEHMLKINSLSAL